MDQGRERFGGTTFGDQLILDTQEKNPKAIRAMIEHYDGPLAIEVMEKPERGDTGRALAVTRKQLDDMGKGATVTSRQKMGQTVFTITFAHAKEGLARLEAVDARFAMGCSNVVTMELPYGVDVFSGIDGARELSNARQADVTFDFNGKSITIPFGKPAEITLLGRAFTLAPDQKAKDAYDAAQNETRKLLDGGRKSAGQRKLHGGDGLPD